MCSLAPLHSSLHCRLPSFVHSPSGGFRKRGSFSGHIMAAFEVGLSTPAIHLHVWQRAEPSCQSIQAQSVRKFEMEHAAGRLSADKKNRGLLTYSRGT